MGSCFGLVRHLSVAWLTQWLNENCQRKLLCEETLRIKSKTSNKAMLPNKPSIRVNSEFKYDNIDKRRQNNLHASQLDVNVCQVNN